MNLYNPSSYTTLAKGQPLFSVGMSSMLSKYTLNGASSTGSVIGLNKIAMVLPLGKRFGMALGLQPFSRRGYNIQQKETIGTDTIRYTYLGTGSTQQVMGGLGYKLLSTKRHELSVGINYSFIFGSVTNERRSELIGNDPVGGVDQRTYRVHGGQYSIGLNYNVALDKLQNQHLRIAAVFTPQQQLSAHRDYFLFFSDDVADPTKYDTLKYSNTDKGNIVYPASMSFGFNYSLRPAADKSYKRKSIYQLNIYGDYSSTLWNNYSTNFLNEHEVNTLRNAHRISLGAQFTPNYDSYAKAVGTSYFNRIRYRAGAYIGTMPNVENAAQLSEYGLTFGLGLPIASQKTNSSFNFSFQYGHRGNGQATGLQEQFVSVNFGVILAPASYDKWFKKYKLD